MTNSLTFSFAETTAGTSYQYTLEWYEGGAASEKVRATIRQNGCTIWVGQSETQEQERVPPAGYTQCLTLASMGLL